MKTILTDIMGTTSPAGFVKTLMSDFAKNGAGFIERAGGEALAVIDKIKQEANLQTGEQVVAYVGEQIAKRNMKPEYLALTGMVNTESYSNGTLKGEFFDDVPAAFSRFRQNGKGVVVYSNGSEASQAGMFRTASQGDLAGLVNGFFDTSRVGSKMEADSYKRISEKIQTGTNEIMYLSDLTSELDAADKAGCLATLVIRPGNKPVEANKYKAVTSFEQL